MKQITLAFHTCRHSLMAIIAFIATIVAAITAASLNLFPLALALVLVLACLACL